MEPSKILTITLQQQEFTCQYPTVGQFIDIKTEEMTLSKGMSRELLLSGLVEEQTAYLMIRALATVKALFPELTERLKVKSLKDIALTDFSEIYNVYLEKIAPWLSTWQETFAKSLEAKT